ncbi:MAG: hypothetical protein OXE82_06825 [Rhodobacter sp.]|nr:hypothetical protein [Rhodobacter sp.]
MRLPEMESAALACRGPPDRVGDDHVGVAGAKGDLDRIEARFATIRRR